MENMNKYFKQASENAGNRELPPALALIREKALQKLSTIEIPNRKVETWKYTNLSSDLGHDFQFQGTSNIPKQISKKEGFYNLIFIDGIFSRNHSDVFPFIIEELESFSNDKLSELVTNKTELSEDFSETINRSFLGTGYVLSFKPDEKCEKPLYIQRIYTQKDRFYNETYFYNLPAFSHIEILEEITSVQKSFINISNHSHTGKNAFLSKNTVQNTDLESLVLYQDNGQILKDARYLGTVFTLGAKKSRTFLNIELLGENSQADLHGLYALNNEQHHDTYSKIHHKTAHTDSRQVYKGIINDNARGVFTGKVRIDQDAQLVNAEQLNKNLLLSKKAHANSRPQLEIYADDVKCSHGSTTGQLSDDELFYFLARGIKKEKARQMLAKAFAHDVILKIPNQEIQKSIQALVEAKNIEV